MRTEGRARARASAKTFARFLPEGVLKGKQTRRHSNHTHTHTRARTHHYDTRIHFTHTHTRSHQGGASTDLVRRGDLGSGMARGPTRAARASWLTGGGGTVTAMHHQGEGPTRRSRSRCPSAPVRVRVVRVRVVRVVVWGFGVRVRVGGWGAAPSRGWRRRQGVGVSRSKRPGLGCVCTSVPGRSCSA